MDLRFAISPTKILRCLGRALLFIAVVLLLPSGLLAQNKQYTKNTPDQTMRSNARVDPSSHALSIQIPLGVYPGRAGLDLPISITYSSKSRHLELDDDFQRQKLKIIFQGSIKAKANLSKIIIMKLNLFPSPRESKQIVRWAALSSP